MLQKNLICKHNLSFLCYKKQWLLLKVFARKLNPNTNIWETSKPVLEKWLKETKDPISKIN